ncbi:Thioesterase/thiol ester dehydrase-isomerase [Imleria badia]|nr:Thioesterase/thiol ester dehydrase-isomerase [Imleria badia]
MSRLYSTLLRGTHASVCSSHRVPVPSQLCLSAAGLRRRTVQVVPSTTIRYLSSSPSAESADTQLTEVQATSETQYVKAMDTLLKAVRARSNPAYRNIIPLRKSMLWSETLLNSSSAPEPIGHTMPIPSQESLPPRNMHDTYTQINLPFKSSPELFEQYTNAYGGLRTGMLMEHLDSLAGSISYKHMLGPDIETLGRISERGFYVVTASVDRLDMLASLYPVRDIRLSGQVVYTGKSSMEVAVKMEALEPDGGEKTLMLGRFSMVCRDARTHKAQLVNPLVIQTAEEQALYSMGKNTQNRRRSLALQSLSRVPPSSEEAAELHQTFLNYGQEDTFGLQSDKVWMGNTKLEKTMLMFPQERNVHQKIFGGYLMRLAYELGFANSCVFTRSHVSFLSLDNISFRKPVNIGSILRLESQILNASDLGELPAVVHVRVQANVVDVKTGREETTNDFRFTFAKDDGCHGMPRIVPKTYQEAMLWLEGKRALEMGIQIRGRRRLGQ